MHMTCFFIRALLANGLHGITEPMLHGLRVGPLLQEEVLSTNATSGDYAAFHSGGSIWTGCLAEGLQYHKRCVLLSN